MSATARSVNLALQEPRSVLIRQPAGATPTTVESPTLATHYPTPDINRSAAQIIRHYAQSVRKTGLDHVVEVLDDAPADRLGTAVDDGVGMLRWRRATAGEAREQQTVQRDRRCRFPATEAIDDLAPALDRDVDRALQRSCQLDAHPRSVRRATELADDEPHAGSHLVQRQPRRWTGRVGGGLGEGVPNVVQMHPAVEVPHPHEPSVGVRACRRRSDLVPVSLTNA